MLQGMKEKETRRRPRKKKDPWHLYILKCNDGSLYTGVTNDLERRLSLHNRGRASRFTRTRRPVDLVYEERLAGRTQALIRECAVKSFPRQKKVELIEGKGRP